MDLKRHIEEIVLSQLTEEEFVVDIVISGEKTTRKILILLDGDNGIDIDRCAEVSRKVAFTLDSEDAIENAYVLEVSSPGLDHPLESLRQYTKNIGRSVKITLTDNSQKKGELLAVTEELLTVRESIKEKGSKKMTTQDITISFKDIKKTNVLVSFK